VTEGERQKIGLGIRTSTRLGVRVCERECVERERKGRAHLHKVVAAAQAAVHEPLLLLGVPAVRDALGSGSGERSNRENTHCERERER
jgi:hypothetical protein